jgi:hypothetical protein
MWFALQSYLQFLWQSNNQHGVHSPFVYQLITKCFYNYKITYPEWGNKKKDLTLKEMQFLWRFFQYIKPCEIIDLSCNKDLENLRNLEINKTVDKKITFFGNELEAVLTALKTKTFLMKNDDIWIVNGMYHNKKNAKIWKSLKLNSSITITVDVYFFGLIFFRKEQAKQNFKIRI